MKFKFVASGAHGGLMTHKIIPKLLLPKYTFINMEYRPK